MQWAILIQISNLKRNEHDSNNNLLQNAVAFTKDIITLTLINLIRKPENLKNLSKCFDHCKKAQVKLNLGSKGLFTSDPKLFQGLEFSKI